MNQQHPLLPATGKRDARFIASLVVLVLLAVAIKWLYLQTAESGYNAEELPLAPMALVGGNSNLADVAATRLYGTSAITTALSLEAFGFNTFAVKFPNLVFLFATLAFLYLAASNLLGRERRGMALVAASLLALGPPVMQVWGMKNRGGFIENICALAFCVWLVARGREQGAGPLAKLALAVAVGLAAWSQPIALVWGCVVLVFVLALEARHGAVATSRTLLLLGCGVLLGMMPLIAMNFLFKFNTFRVLDAGELVGGVDLGRMGRLRELLSGGLPRLLGLKEQWSTDWVVAAPLGRALYFVLMLPVAIASAFALLDLVRKRKATVELLLVAVAAAILLVNVVSSWGNFQLEPRRLLVLYVPFVLLTASALARSRTACVLYLCVFFGLSAWTNYAYVQKHRHGFTHPMYVPLDGVASFLAGHKIKGVYTDAWTGGRVTFASGGHIAWFKSEYIPTAYGFVSDTLFEPSEAFLFNPHSPEGAAQKDAFLADLARAKLACSVDLVQEITIVHGCSGGAVDLVQLPYGSQASTPGTVVERFPADDPRVKTLSGALDGGALKAGGKAGYLMYGPYYAIGRGAFSVLVDGHSTTPFTIDAVAFGGKSTLASKQYASAAGGAEGGLARLDFDLAMPARDLEIRILVPEGSDATVQGYRIVRR